jgi:anaerobic dimethyl sulfoxide reductase subunit B (iron-sulfur subunit)
MSCKDKNNLPFGEKYRRVYDYGGGSWDVDDRCVVRNNNFFLYYLSLACNHCAAPACITVCPVDAISKRNDGIVSIDQGKCIGCGSCVTACPYGASYVSEITGVAHKCDFCKDLIDQGDEPMCIKSCTMRCLKYGELEDLRAIYGSLDSYPPVSANTDTGPSVVFTPCRLDPNGTLPGVILNSPEEIVSKTYIP